MSTLIKLSTKLLNFRICKKKCLRKLILLLCHWLSKLQDWSPVHDFCLMGWSFWSMTLFMRHFILGFKIINPFLPFFLRTWTVCNITISEITIHVPHSSYISPFIMKYTILQAYYLQNHYCHSAFTCRFTNKIKLPFIQFHHSSRILYCYQRGRLCHIM